MVQRGLDSFSARLIWNSWAPIKVSFFFCLGSNLEKDSNHGHLEEERLDFGEQMFSM